MVTFKMHSKEQQQVYQILGMHFMVDYGHMMDGKCSLIHFIFYSLYRVEASTG